MTINEDINEEVYMFSSQMLDAAIGLVFVYFFLSLLCSVIVEIFTSLTKKRAIMLKDGIVSLLGKENQEAIKKLYAQPLFMGNSVPENGLRETFTRSSEKERFPSYISSRSFVLSLLASLKQHPDVARKVLQDAIDSKPSEQARIDYCRGKVQSLPDDHQGKANLLASLEAAEHDLDSVPSAIKQCCDEIVKDPAVLIL